MITRVHHSIFIHVDKAVAPLRELLPGAKISLAGVSGTEMATLLLALLVCWLPGWGIVRTRLGRPLSTKPIAA